MVKQTVALAFSVGLCCLSLMAADDQQKREDEFYRIVTIPTPPTQFEAASLELIGEDTLACGTRIGEIWIGRGVLGDPPNPKWTCFASGLQEVLGLATRDGWIYAVQRGEVTRLKDTNGDGRADIVETFCDDWGLSGRTYEFAFGSKFDREGNLWVALGLTDSKVSGSYYRGWCLRVTPEGRAIPTVSGLREPGGMGFNAAGDCFCTDNQGEWNGACKLQWLKPGTFAGSPDSLKWFDQSPTKETIAAAGLKRPANPKDGGRMYDEAKAIPELALPAVYFPYEKMGQSASGIACDLTGGKFGPFREQLFVGDQTYSTVMRVALESVAGAYQGACFPFRQGFDSGNLALELATNGALFVFGTDRGWPSRGGKSFALQRLDWTGRAPFEILTMNAEPDGFQFTFTEPVDADSAKRLESWSIGTFTYIYQSGYGSAEVDLTTPVIQEIKVSPDGMKARLIIKGLVEGHIHECHLAGVRSARGEPLLHDTAYYTLNKIPAQARQ